MIICILLAILTFALGYVLHGDIMKLWKWWNVKRKEDPKQENLPPKPKPTSDGGMCHFSQEDTVLKNVHGYDGKHARFSSDPNLVKFSCSECNQYVFKDEDGCIPYGFDKVENCPNGNCNGILGVCTIGDYIAMPKKPACSKDTDCSPGLCMDGTCKTWEIPASKKCPF